MSKKRKIISLIVLGVLMLASLALSLLCGRAGPKESLRTIMRDAVLHEDNKISLFGWMDVNPAVVSGMVVTGALLLLAALARLLVIPRFRSLRNTEIWVFSVTRRRNESTASNNPISIAIVRLKITVNIKVTHNTAISAF